jgi:hypothetical protein
MPMAVLKKYSFILELIFFVFIFIVTILPMRDFDIWFHWKSGELIAHKGIIHYDVFSHTAAGREWFPYEWLFQVTVYYFSLLFGFEAIKYLIAAMISVMVSILYYLTKYLFKLNMFVSMLVSFFFIASVYEFFSARPHIFAYTFFIATVFLILL